MHQPEFMRDELVLILEHQRAIAGGSVADYDQLSETLRGLGLHEDMGNPEVFRSAKGVGRAVRRFNELEAGRPGPHRPSYVAVWDEYANRPDELQAEAARIRSASPARADVQAERERREGMWQALVLAGDPTSLAASVINGQRVFRGGRGIWADKDTTGGIGGAPAVTVGFLLTGARYPDDLSDTALLYHYPQTDQAGRDEMEIEATRAASRLGLPVFAVIKHGSRREVRRGIVVEWDDESQLFLVEFAENPAAYVPEPVLDEEAPFDLHVARADGRRSVRTRPNQQRFRFAVLHRYGPKCALCRVDAPELLTAAHIVAVEHGGSDDPRNGLVLCWNHHRAFDLDLVAIGPDFSVGPTGDRTLEDLGVTVDSVRGLRARPAVEALAARAEKTRGGG